MLVFTELVCIGLLLSSDPSGKKEEKKRKEKKKKKKKKKKKRKERKERRKKEHFQYPDGAQTTSLLLVVDRAFDYSESPIPAFEIAGNDHTFVKYEINCGKAGLIYAFLLYLNNI